MANTTVTLDDDLCRVYSRDKLFEPAERSKHRVWDDMEEADDERPGGAGLYFRILGAAGHAQGNPAEGGDWSDTQTRLEVQCSVTSAQMDSSVEISSKFMEAAKGDGSFSGDAEHDAIVEVTEGLFNYADKLIGCGHGTGRLAVVDANVVGSTTFTCKVPERAFQLRPNQTVDFVDLDTGGTVQDSAKITDINYVTGVVTVDSAVTLTAGWGVYQVNSYGNPFPNGLRNIVDDGDYSSTIFGVSRTAPNTFMNAVVLDNSGGLQDYSEDLVNDLLDQITFRQDLIPTELRCNMGIIGEHRRVTTPDRVYNQSGATPPNYSFGTNHESLAFTYGTTKIPFVTDRNLPARELYALYKPAWKKHTLRKADWFKVGGQILHIKPANAGGTLTYSYIGAMMMDMNVSCRKLNAQGKLSNIRDRGAARD